MSNPNQIVPEKLPYLEETLENGEPVRHYTDKGATIDLTADFRTSPTSAALVKLDDGRTVAANPRSMLMLGSADENGRFSRTEGTVGVNIAGAYPDGIPPVRVGEQWGDIGVPVKVLFAPRDAFAPISGLSPDAPTPGVNMLGSAMDLLSDFEAAQPQPQFQSQPQPPKA